MISAALAIVALAAAVLAFIFIVPEKCRAKLNGFGKFLHDLFNFKFMIIEKIFQFCYVFATAFVIIFGFFNLFNYSYYLGWTGYNGLLMMILGPIAVRIVYELLMLAIIAVKNIIQINNKLKGQNDNQKETLGELNLGDYKTDRPIAPVGKFCTKCGSPLNADGTCPNCK